VNGTITNSGTDKGINKSIELSYYTENIPIASEALLGKYVGEV
jgi:hypothetical protein